MSAKAGPLAANKDGWDTWGEPAVDWSQNPWAVQAKDTWSLTEQIDPWQATSVFADRWASYAVDTLIPFWTRGVESAARGHEPQRFAEFLDGLEQSGFDVWKGMPDIRDEWKAPQPDGTHIYGSERSWGSGLRSRPQTESLAGDERPPSKTQKMAILERKGICWPDDSPSKYNTPDVRKSSSAKSKKARKSRAPAFRPEEHQEWVEDMIVKLRVNTKLGRNLRDFWLLSTDEKVQRIIQSVRLLSDRHTEASRPPKPHSQRNRNRRR